MNEEHESQGLKILLADDSPTQAAMLRMALRRKGYQVLLAKDGLAAVEEAYRWRPDLLVSDIVMPRLTGIQVCRLLKEDMSDLPIILLTSLEEKADRFWGKKSGANLYLTKSGDIDSLVEDIETFIVEKGVKSRSTAVPSKESPESQDKPHVIFERVLWLLDQSLFDSTVLGDIGELVNNLDDCRRTLYGVLKMLAEVIHYDVGVINLVSEESREYYIYINGTVTESFLNDARSVMDHFLVHELGFQRLPEEMVVDIEDPQGIKPQPGSRGGPEINSRSLRKLMTKNVPSGAMGLFSSKDNLLGERINHTFDLVSRQANIVIDYARLYERNKQLSITDGLTKVYNHRFFQESLKREFSRSVRHKTRMSLIMMDIDNFKKFNDTYGHQQGDLVLQEMARLLKKTLRSMDIVSRYGGEEFTIIMPDAGLQDAGKVAERLRRSIEETDFPGLDGRSLKVTVSMGVSCIPHPLICNPAQMINAADQALYLAKKKGRNRVEESE